MAPRARMAENAAWPGVSRKVIFSPEGSWTEQQKGSFGHKTALLSTEDAKKNSTYYWEIIACFQETYYLS